MVAESNNESTGLARRKAALAANRKDPGEARLSHQAYRWLHRGLRRYDVGREDAMT